MCIYGQRLGLVDDLNAGGKSDNEHRSAAPVGIPNASRHLRQHSGIAIGVKGRPDRIPVPAQAVEKFKAGINPSVNTHDKLAGEHRVFL
jgi:hypothetical protein